MAFAIMGGLLVATLLTLIFLPVLYIAVFGNDKAASPGVNAPSAENKPQGLNNA
jgi:hypothetical protein